MRKLALEALAVESFETSDAAPALRGTVAGHADDGKCSSIVIVPTYNVQECGDTKYFHCTYGCSWDTRCAWGCPVPIETRDGCATV